ncbi:hypothetical protein EST38_g2618 [Candolleomyces aberdarensis]|uniref:AAA protein C-terminal winged helix domain-containing protein n=1 Tax=Candolleomyces aberdarensis TaxID=2316362 RepID=A0A4Q2DU48_9AGAR|nr:hypothetical protein EST38_g2618 [Candolleomyces aberdarensis]
MTACIGLGTMFLGGIVYLRWYKANVLDKIELAFEAGYDPALELAQFHTSKKAASEDSEFEGDEPWTEHLRRKEQDTIDHIIRGEEPGHYFMFLGPKGCGKGTMIFDCMASIQADGVTLCEAHPDLEVFRLRLGKVLNYEFNEDTQAGLFQRRDPREGGPALDIERALNKLEKVALRCAKRRGKPFVLVINNIHFFQNDENGRNMILQLQQKAEAWAASGILTVVFSSDDFWPFHIMRKSASRMHVLSVSDLRQSEAVHVLTRMRRDANIKSPSPDEIRSIVDIVGGRLSYLSRAARSRDMEAMARHMLAIEKGWILSRIGLIPDCDDDVMDEQKWSSCSWLLLEEFVKIRRAQEKEREEAIANGEVNPEDLNDLPLPAISWYKCRQIMTRADFMEDLDRANIISIDIDHNVRPDSVLTLQAVIEVVEEESFEELLHSVRAHIDEIESLRRMRELAFKDVDKGDMIRLSVDNGADMIATIRGRDGR